MKKQTAFEEAAALHRIRQGAAMAMEYFEQFQKNVTLLEVAIKAGATNPLTVECLAELEAEVRRLKETVGNRTKTATV
jgi:hypothetical protein